MRGSQRCSSRRLSRNTGSSASDNVREAEPIARRFIERIWKAAQTMPEYSGRTSLLVTTDHGRGATTADWTKHGREVAAAGRTWIAVLGPDVPALGVRRDVNVTTSQGAATIASLVREDFAGLSPPSRQRCH